jgi:hypothetical protein
MATATRTIHIIRRDLVSASALGTLTGMGGTDNQVGPLRRPWALLDLIFII